MCLEAQAKNQAIQKAVSTVGNGGAFDIYVDLLQVPVGYYAIIYGISIRTPIGRAQCSSPCVFACDQTYSYGSIPLVNNGVFDSSKGGCALTGSDQTMPSGANIATSWLNAGQTSSNGAPLFLLPPNWFLRVATQSGGSGGQVTNAQFEVSVLFALMPICDE